MSGALILTIDDEKFVRKSMRFFLEDCEYQVIEAENGRMGLDLFYQKEPDLVLLDLRMPMMDGLEVLKQISASHEQIPVIVVSGNGEMRDVVQALRLGAWDYLIKPIEDLSMLQHAIERALERARLILENKSYRESLEETVNARTAELRDSNQELETLITRLHKVVETTRRISGFSRMEGFGSRLLEEFGAHMEAQGGSLYLRTERGFELVHSLDPGHASHILPMPPPEGSVLDKAFSAGTPLLIEDISQCEDCKASGWDGYESSALLVFPLTGEEERVVGLISLHGCKDRSYNDKDLEIGSVLASYSSEALVASHAVEALSASEERKELALHGANLGMWDWNLETGSMLMDRRTEEILGYARGELEPHVDTWENHVLPEDLPKARRELEGHIEGRSKHFECEYRVLTRYGEQRWVHDRGKVVERDENGKALRFAGTHLDITDRKNTELALRESEVKFRAIIENNPVPMLITEGMTTVSFINKAFTEQFGYNNDEIPEMGMWWETAFPDPNYREQISAGWLGVASSSQADANVEVLEWRLTCADSKVRDVEVKLVVLDGFVLTALNDVTERKEAEAFMERRNKDLAKRVEDRDAMLLAAQEELKETAQKAGMAELATGTIHNIGNILNSVGVSTDQVSTRLDNSKIKGLLMANQLLKDHQDHLTEFLTNDPKGKQMPKYFLALGQKLNTEYDQIRAEIDSLKSQVVIMRDVIAAQQSYARKGGGGDERLPLSQIIEHSLKLQKHLLERAGIEVGCDYDVEPVGAFSRVKLTHVLVNLIKNGTEAMSECRRKGREPVMTIHVDADEHHAYVSVIDNGCGISAENIEKIFSFGFTTKDSGHGFGLHTCARWMEELGGNLCVLSDGAEKGATFKMTIPL